MTEKVRLPKNVCDALDEARKSNPDAAIVIRCFDEHEDELKATILGQQDPELIMRALVLGYEPELTPEEQLKERYENRGDYCTYEHFLGYRDGVKDALHLHGIKYDWIKGWGEEDEA